MRALWPTMASGGTASGSPSAAERTSSSCSKTKFSIGESWSTIASATAVSPTLAVSLLSGRADGPGPLRRRRVDVLGDVVRAHLERVRAAREIAVDRRVEALHPHVRVTRVQAALVLEELRRRLVVDRGEREGRGAVRADERRLLGELVSGGDSSMPEKWCKLGSRNGVLLDVAGAVDRPDREGEEALLHQRHRVRARAPGPPLLDRHGLPRRDRLGRLGELDLEQAALVLEVFGRGLVVRPGELEGRGLGRVLDRAAQVLALGRLVVRVGRIPTYSKAPASHLPFCGRSMPRWSVSGHGAIPWSTARLSRSRRCVRVSPPLSAIASSFAFPSRSRPSFGLSLDVGGWFRKHAVLRGSRISSGTSGSSRMPPPSTFPPSDVMYQSQRAALEAAADELLRAMSARFGWGGSPGRSRTRRRRWRHPRRRVPPDRVALQPHLAVGVVEQTAAAVGGLVARDRRVLELRVAVRHEKKPPPRPPSSGSPSSVRPGWRATLLRISVRLTKRSLSGRLASPPPLSALLRWIVESSIVNGPLEELHDPAAVESRRGCPER